MTYIQGTADIESMINSISRANNTSINEDIRVGRTRLQANSEKVRDKREANIENLKERMKDVQVNPCLKFFASLFKVLDTILNPISHFTDFEIGFELGKILKKLKKGIENQKITGLKIEGKEIKLAIDQVKKIISEDLDNLNEANKSNERDNKKIFKMLDDFENSLETISQS